MLLDSLKLTELDYVKPILTTGRFWSIAMRAEKKKENVNNEGDEDKKKNWT